MTAVAGISVDACYEVYTLRYGTRETTRSKVFLDYALYNEPEGRHVVDYYFWVLRSTDRTIVVDTGFNAETARRRGRTFLHDPIDMLQKDLDIGAGEVDTIVATHCHYDHIGNLARFPAAQVHLAAAELDFVRSGLLTHPPVGHFTEPDEVDQFNYLDAAGRLTAADGSWDLAPGVRVLPGRGHTPGQLMVEVLTSAGNVLLASDAVHFVEELDRDMPFISSMDLPATYRTFATIRERLASGEIDHLIPGHDAATLDEMDRLNDHIGVIS